MPGKISHAEFWRNLLYRIEQLRLEQATREQLKQRASQQVATVSTSSDKWEDEEEQQTSVAPAVVQETESQKPMDSQDCVPTENVQQTAPESREIAEASGEEKQETEQAAESPVTDAPQETQPEKAKTGKAANDSQVRPANLSLLFCEPCTFLWPRLFRLCIEHKEIVSSKPIALVLVAKFALTLLFSH